MNSGPPSLKTNVSCIAWNVQSIRNKCAEVLEHVVDKDADVVFLSETWMEAEKNDITAMVKEKGYKYTSRVKFYHFKITCLMLSILKTL